MKPESSWSPETIHKHAEMYKHQPESIMAECECNLFFWMRRFIIVCLISSYIQASRLTRFYWICLDSRVECLPIKKLPLNMSPCWGIKKKKRKYLLKVYLQSELLLCEPTLNLGHKTVTICLLACVLFSGLFVF